MRTLSVTGSGAARATPDTALVRVSAVHRDASLNDALAGAESARAAIVDTATLVSPALVVSSLDLSIWPSTDSEGRPDGFEARHSLSIRCPRLTVAGDLVGRLAAGVGDRLQVDGVSLTVADPSAALVTAREAAFADARTRAEHLAGLAGGTLGEVQSVTEGGSGAAPVARELAMAKVADVAFAPGETTVSADLSVVFQLL